MCLGMEKANSILDFPGHVSGDADSFRKRSLDSIIEKQEKCLILFFLAQLMFWIFFVCTYFLRA